jgi:hypothetical protein
MGPADAPAVPAPAPAAASAAPRPPPPPNSIRRTPVPRPPRTQTPAPTRYATYAYSVPMMRRSDTLPTHHTLRIIPQHQRRKDANEPCAQRAVPTSSAHRADEQCPQSGRAVPTEPTTRSPYAHEHCPQSVLCTAPRSPPRSAPRFPQHRAKECLQRSQYAPHRASHSTALPMRRAAPAPARSRPRRRAVTVDVGPAPARQSSMSDRSDGRELFRLTCSILLLLCFSAYPPRGDSAFRALYTTEPVPRENHTTTLPRGIGLRRPPALPPLAARPRLARRQAPPRCRLGTGLSPAWPVQPPPAPRACVRRRPGPQDRRSREVR